MTKGMIHYFKPEPLKILRYKLFIYTMDPLPEFSLKFNTRDEAMDFLGCACDNGFVSKYTGAGHDGNEYIVFATSIIGAAIQEYTAEV